MHQGISIRIHGSIHLQDFVCLNVYLCALGDLVYLGLFLVRLYEAEMP